ncbi:MAG: chaperonin GroEL, partial [Roseiflexaceae bacterium]
VDMGAMLLRNALSKTAQTVGDGTATTAVLLQEIVRHGMLYLEAGYDTVALRRGLERGCAAAVAALRDMARPLDGLAAIRRCADTLCSDDELAFLLGEIFDIVGTQGYVQVDGGYTRGLERQYIEGVYWDEGYLSPYFITDPLRQEARLEQPAILISNLRITSAEQLAPLLDRVVQAGLTSLMIIAQEVSGSALGMLVHNHQSGTLHSFAVKSPLAGAQQAAVLEDLAVLTGGIRITEEAGWRAQSVTTADLGSARLGWASEKAFGVRGVQGDPHARRRRIADVQSALARVNDPAVAEQLRARLGRLWGGAAVLRVGAGTRGEAETRKARAQRMVTSLRLALEGGVVPGGGRAYLLCQQALQNLVVSPAEQVGVRALAEALAAPLAAIAHNAGHEPTTVVARVQASAAVSGFDARSGQLVDLWAAGILDPALVAETALTTAVSGAIMALTTDVLVHRRNPTAVIEP